MRYFATAALLLLPALARLAHGGSVVTLEHTNSGARLILNGQPYFIKGAGGKDRLAELAAAGGNSIRTWSTDNLEPLLDEARSNGLTVTIGFWMGHPRHGFDYTDGEAVTRQVDDARAAILRYKDHPALLMWAIGNEMEGDGKNPAIWYAVNHIARICKELDPNHPVATIIADVGEPRVEYLHRFCPDVDIVGINTYGGFGSIGERYRKAGGTKPFAVTEFGPPGQWEMTPKPWGAPPELTSSEKAKFIREGYAQNMLKQPLCLGSYAFVWGFKQEATATWHGLFLKDGARTESIDALTELWGGPAPTNRCPTISVIQVDRDDGLQPNDLLTARVELSDPDNDPLDVRWIFRRESGLYATGGDDQPDQPEFPDAVVESDNVHAIVKMPAGGSYRLYAYAYDGKGNAAIANVPLHAEGPPPAAAPATKASFPFALYEDGLSSPPYIPSGYMGNHSAMRVDEHSGDQPRAGATCMKVAYTASDNWAGVAWQNPANDWGDQPGGFDLSGATELEFWARGASGGEIVSFGIGLIGNDKKYSDSVTKVEVQNIPLGTQWQRFRIPLDGRDLTRIKTGFYWTFAAQGRPLTYYLDDIRYVARP